MKRSSLALHMDNKNFVVFREWLLTQENAEVNTSQKITNHTVQLLYFR